MTRRFEIVFVDAVDTLLRARGSVGRLYAPIATRHGCGAQPDAIDAAFKHAISSAPPPVFPQATPEQYVEYETAWWREVVRRTFEPLGGVPRFETFFPEVFELFRSAEAWEILPGARAALDVLRAEDRRLGIISEMDGRLFDVLQAFDLRQYFEPIVLSTRTGASKRDAALFPVALVRAALPAVNALHIGDSLTSDVAGARAAGMAAIWFATDANQAAPDDVPAARSWDEIPAQVRRLEAS